MSDNLPAWAMEQAKQIDVTGVHRGVNVHIAIASAIVAADKAATERAAKECDRIAGNTKDFDRDYRRAAGHCAAAIRNQEPINPT